MIFKMHDKINEALNERGMRLIEVLFAKNKQRVWEFVRFMPAVFILWHCYLLYKEGPGTFFLLWLVNLSWIVIYGRAQYCLQQPNRNGYWYILLLISANVLGEMLISYRILAEGRLLAFWCLNSLIALLYWQRERFKIGQISEIFTVVLLLTSIGSGMYWQWAIFGYKRQGEYARWQEQTIGSQKRFFDKIIWISNEELFGYIYDKNLDDEVLTYFNLRKKEKRIFEGGNSGAVLSADRQWVAYFTGNYGSKSVQQYVRKQTGSKEVEILAEGKRLSDYVQPISSQTSRWIVGDNPHDSDIRIVRQPNDWPVSRWNDATNQLPGKWLPDGKRLLVRREEKNKFLYIVDAESGREEKIPLRQELVGVNPKTVEFSPEGECLYAAAILKGGEVVIYKYDLQHQESGWEVMPDLKQELSIGANGISVFYKRFFPGGPYYINSRGLGDLGIWLYRPEARQSVRITGGCDIKPQISPDGKKIVFLRKNDDFNGYDVMLLEYKE